MTVDATRHNNLQARIEQILGVGANEFGYGQPVSSYRVSNSEISNLNLIRAEDINLMYTDLIRARAHQTGIETTEIAELVADLNLIAEETSNQIDNNANEIIDPSGTKKGIADYERLMTKIENNKFDIFTGTLELGINSVRTTPWNGIITHEILVTFENADHRRHFFNSGGEIRFSANNTGAIGDKGKDWAEILNDPVTGIGTVKFNYTDTIATLTGSGSSIGNYDLTSSYQQIYQKIGNGTYSGIYAGNIYSIKAKAISPSQIGFLIEFNDLVTGTTVDNDVDGSLTSTVQQFRADTDYVRVNPPAFFNNSSL